MLEEITSIVHCLLIEFVAPNLVGYIAIKFYHMVSIRNHDNFLIPIIYNLRLE